MKDKKFKLPNMDFSEILAVKTETEQELIINDSLTYNNVKPYIDIILNNENNITTIKCLNINDIDITGLQFLISVKMHNHKIKIETNFTEEIELLLKKTGCNFLI